MNTKEDEWLLFINPSFQKDSMNYHNIGINSWCTKEALRFFAKIHRKATAMDSFSNEALNVTKVTRKEFHRNNFSKSYKIFSKVVILYINFEQLQLLFLNAMTVHS